jgi:hypothetical protein
MKNIEGEQANLLAIDDLTFSLTLWIAGNSCMVLAVNRAVKYHA